MDTNIAGERPLATRTGTVEALKEYGIVVGGMAALLWLTSPYTHGDMMVYSTMIARAFETGGVANEAGLWEFGHLLWRPLGWIMTWAVIPAASGADDWRTALVAARVLITLNVLATMLSVVLWYSMARSITRSQAFALVVTIGLASGNGFLNYAQTGSSYVFGLALVSLATWVAFWSAERERLSIVSACGVGLSIGLATTVWFPFILAAPACALTAVIWKSPHGLYAVLRRDSLIYVSVAAGAFLVVLSLAFAAAASVIQFDSMGQFATWAVDSGHGWSQSQTITRLATGVPRLFYYLGWDGLVWKRFMFDDPYAPVAVGELICCSSLWKIATCWALVLGLPVFLLFFRTARPALWLMTISGAPLLWFAVFVMEPSSPERFLPAYPHILLLLSVVYTIDGRWRKPARIVVTLCLASMFATNSVAMWKPFSQSRYDAAVERIIDVQQRVGEQGSMYFLSGRDPAKLLKRQRPFHPINQNMKVNAPNLIEPAMDVVLRWRERFAELTLNRWNRGGEVWMSNRVLATRPKPDWLWVEGDDPRVKWSDLRPFFMTLDRPEELGGEDGFFLVVDNTHNREILARLSATGSGQD